MKTAIDSIVQNNVPETYTSKDFKPDNDVRWCLGCGAYSVLFPVQKFMPDLGVPKEKIAFVSGIGCSGRFPYYMETYGFHGIHGRPIAIASGLKVARTDLSVWVVTGDGDCMSIGGNHFIHGARRNVDLNVLMFNNEVYSLTKGQYSPTSRKGQVTKTSPFGVLEDPFDPVKMAITSGATFVARGYDKDRFHIQYLIERAARHKGFSFVELYTNCLIFNDEAFDGFTRKEVRDDFTVNLQHGKPLLFGKDHDKGIRLNGFKPEIIDLKNGFTIDDVLVHDETDSTLAYVLACMADNPDLPRPVGVFYCAEKPSYDELVEAQIAHEMETKGEGTLEELLLGDEYWQVN